MQCFFFIPVHLLLFFFAISQSSSGRSCSQIWVVHVSLYVLMHPPLQNRLLLLLLLVAATVCRLRAASMQAADSVLVVPRGSGQFSTRQNASFWRTADFTLGFQRVADVADEAEYLLCIWRSADINQTALWWPSVADFNQTAVQLLTRQGSGENSTGVALTKKTPTVANGTIFTFTRNGSLQLISGDVVLWSVGNNASTAEFLNTGNLVLLDESTSNSTIWQSFGDRRDTMIMPAKQGIASDVDLVINNPLLLQSRSSANQSSSSYAPGRFHVETDEYQNLYLHALEEYYGVDYIYSYGAINVSGYFTVSKGSTRVYKSNASMGVSLVKLDPDSNIRVYIWSESRRSWHAVWQILSQKCWLASPCGPFGICQEIDDGSGTSLNCICPPGYSFIDPLDATKGCRSDGRLNFSVICAAPSNYSADSYTMATVANTDYNYGDIGSTNTVTSVAECIQLCLNLCECAAAAFLVNGNCYLKGNNTAGIVMNGYRKDSSTLLIKLKKDALYPSKESNRGSIEVGAIAGVVVLVLGLVTATLCVVRRSRGRGRWSSAAGKGGAALILIDGNDEVGSPTIKFTWQQLVEATHNFSHLLGEGGFGKVYKGWVKHKATTSSNIYIRGRRHHRRASRSRTTAAGATVTDEAVVKAVAVKVLKVPPLQLNQVGDDRANEDYYWAARQFKAEVSTLSKIHHVNLVNLIGYCDEEVNGQQMRALVFEFMERGSLDQYLSGYSKKRSIGNEEEVQHPEQLAWERRYSIAVGMARGITYLHHECNPPILHSDIKPQNVLLDDQFTAKVADFGFARRFQQTTAHVMVSVVQGTRGYMAPEWLKTDEITSKVDVYSFGVVLLELVRGRCGNFKYVHKHDSSNSDDSDDILPAVHWASRYLQGLLTQQDETASDLPLTYSNNNDKDPDASASKDAASMSMTLVPSLVANDGFDDAESSQGAGGDRQGEDGEQIDVNREQQEQKVRLLKIGLWCVQNAPHMRPSMQQVLRLLEASNGNIETPPIPPSPLPPPPPLEWSNDSIDSPSNFIEPFSAVSGR